MHKADKGSCSFDDSFYSFKGVKTQILFPFIQLFSLWAGERSHIPSFSFAISPLKAVICHQVPSARSAGRQEAKKECCRWPVPASEGRSIREDPQSLSVCSCSSSCKSWFTDAKGDENTSASEMDGLCCPGCSLHSFQLPAGPQDFLRQNRTIIMVVSLESHAAFSVNIIWRGSKFPPDSSLISTDRGSKWTVAVLHVPWELDN